MSISFIFLVKSFLGNFYRHLAIFFWSHWCYDRFWATSWRTCAELCSISHSPDGQFKCIERKTLKCWSSSPFGNLKLTFTNYIQIYSQQLGPNLLLGTNIIFIRHSSLLLDPKFHWLRQIATTLCEFHWQFFGCNCQS